MSVEHKHSRINTDHTSIFGIGIALNAAYIIIEAVYGIIVHSMSLLADAGHNLIDVLSLFFAWGAAYLAKTAITNKRTYGLRKSTILAALLNSIILLIAVGAITIEAIRRIVHPEPTAGNTIMIVAGIGVIINTITAVLFLKVRKNDLNIRGAFIHMASDAGVSLGVVAAGLMISLTGFYLLDPLISLVIVLVITISTWSLLKDSFHLSMDAVPRNINLNDVENYLRTLDGVDEVHDLHVWAMSTTEIALTAHLVIPDMEKDDNFLSKICFQLHSKFGIEHSTIQIEKSAQGSNCEKHTV